MSGTSSSMHVTIKVGGTDLSWQFNSKESSKLNNLSNISLHTILAAQIASLSSLLLSKVVDSTQPTSISRISKIILALYMSLKNWDMCKSFCFAMWNGLYLLFDFQVDAVACYTFSLNQLTSVSLSLSTSSTSITSSSNATL